MINFLQKEFYSNTVSAYLCVFVSILLGVLLKRLISKYFASVLFRLVARTGKKLNKLSFVSLIIPPLENFLFLLIAFVALDKLSYPKELNFRIYKVTLFDVVDSASSIALVVTFTWLCLRAIDFIATVLGEVATKTSDHSESQLIIFFKDFLKMLLGIIGLLMVLRFGFHKDIGNLITGLSLVGAAIALATKESLENLIASFIIFFDKPFTVGDTLKVNSLTGVVEKIGLRSTRIRTEEKTYISVPNKQMVDSIIDNLSMRTQRRVVTNLEISLLATAEQLRGLTPSLNKILEQDKDVASFSVFLKDTGQYAHKVEVTYFADVSHNPHDFNMMREAINLKIIALLEDMKLSLAGSTSHVFTMDKAG